MNNTVDIEFVPDKNCIDSNVIIRAREKTKLVENIIHAVENVSEEQFSKKLLSGASWFSMLFSSFPDWHFFSEGCMTQE